MATLVNDVLHNGRVIGRWVLVEAQFIRCSIAFWELQEKKVSNFLFIKKPNGGICANHSHTGRLALRSSKMRACDRSQALRPIAPQIHPEN